ncbi:MAG: hypothetical protein ACRD4K_09130, partial [Candidatus Acidiferrales bacterium]
LAGLTQGWSLFAPNPTNSNCRLSAEIQHEGGSTNTWNFPLPQDFGYSYFLERDRKWANDNLRMDRNSALWPDAARYVARINDDSSHRPVAVKFFRICIDIQPPGVKTAANPPAGKPENFFTYQVKPGDLQ